MIGHGLAKLSEEIGSLFAIAFGVVDRSHGIRPVIGIECTVAPATGPPLAFLRQEDAGGSFEAVIDMRLFTIRRSGGGVFAAENDVAAAAGSAVFCAEDVEIVIQLIGIGTGENQLI